MQSILPTFAFLNLSPYEIAAIVFVVLLLFGAKRLPELARGAAKAIKEFKHATSEAEATFKEALKEEPTEEKPKQSQTSTNTSQKTS